MNVLQKTLFEPADNARRIPPENIFNADEMGLTICHKLHMIVATKGKKSVGGLMSAECGKHYNFVLFFGQ